MQKQMEEHHDRSPLAIFMFSLMVGQGQLKSLYTGRVPPSWQCGERARDLLMPGKHTDCSRLQLA